MKNEAEAYAASALEQVAVTFKMKRHCFEDYLAPDEGHRATTDTGGWML